MRQLAQALRGSRYLTAVCALAVVVTGYRASASSSFAGEQAQPGWRTFRDPAGFSLQIPAGWKVSRSSENGRIDLSGPQKEQVVIWPEWAPRGLDGGTARAMVMQFVRRIGGELSLTDAWEAPQQVSATAVRSIAHHNARAGTMVLLWIPTANGAATFFYAIAAPEAAYREKQAQFGRILQSFRIDRGSGGNAAPQASDSQVKYVAWTDPNEGAFSLQVPQSWKVEGGLIRRNALDPRFVARLTSPDGAIILSSGDAQLPGFVLPNPQWAGVFPEGSWYSPGAGIQWQVRRFMAAVPFGQEWLQLRLQGLCSELAIKDKQERPDLARAMDREAAGFAQFGRVTNSAGELAFTCNQAGQPKQGFLLVSTQLIQSGVLNLWYAKDLLGYLAPPARTAEAQAILAHVAQSLQVSPQWVARQQQTTMQVSQIAADTQQHISNSIMSSYWSKGDVDTELSRKWENANLGTTDVIDPATGEQKKIYNSGSYAWIDNRGRIVGTQTDSSPGLDFRALINLP